MTVNKSLTFINTEVSTLEDQTPATLRLLASSENHCCYSNPLLNVLSTKRPMHDNQHSGVVNFLLFNLDLLERLQPV